MEHLSDHKTQPQNYYRDTPLFQLSHEDGLQLVFQALDALEEPVLVVDNSTRICYFNTAYANTYGEGFQKAGIPLGEITNWKLTNMRGEKEVVPILDVLERQVPLLKYYAVHTIEDVATFTDIIPLSLGDQRLGAVIIIRDSARIAHLSHEMNNYRVIAEQLRRELNSKLCLPLAFRSIIGSSAEFIQVLLTAAQVAPSNASVCLTGESGTGKEVLANAIHFSSKFSDGPFIKVNCAAIPESLIESELFGYEKGAFTGARATGNPGKFELANNGTLFLDEIGEMPLSMQVKLLRALQEQEVTRVGGIKPIKLNFRLITATNRKLETMVAEESFREDLYYRISVITLSLPPLRQRRGDIVTLANHFLNEFKEQYGGNPSFSSEVTELLSDYLWPGNIRELKNCVERMAVLNTGDVISTDLLPPQILDNKVRKGAKPAENYRLQSILEKTERDTIIAVLGITGGNKSKAISILGISKRNFYMKLEKYGLK